MSSQREWWAEKSEVINADLPDDLQAAAHWSNNDKELLLDFPSIRLDKSDFPKLIVVLKKFGGDLCNRRESGDYFFSFPRVVPSQAGGASGDAKSAVVPQVSQSSGGNKVAESQSDKVTAPKEPEKPVATKQPQNSCNTATSQPQPQQQPAASPAPKVEQAPKQPSPVEHFASNNCASCSDYGVTCSCKADSPHRDVCFKIMLVQQLQELNVNLAKLASRPVYRGGGKPQQARELHVDGGIRWCWNQAHTYEQAWAEDNKDSKEYADLKAKLAAAKEAGKKGVFIGDFWVFLDGYGKDAVLRKKTQQNGGK